MHKCQANGYKGYNAFQAAAENDNLDVVKLWVNKGANVQYKIEHMYYNLLKYIEILNYRISPEALNVQSNGKILNKEKPIILMGFSSYG